MLKRLARRSQPYPLAALAAYGPDDTVATKLVAAVLERPGQDPPSAMKTWTTLTGDVRTDPFIAKNVSEFLLEHGVKDSVSADRILGCPHEEGVDYPIGRACPHCPFWAGIDRFTQQPFEPPVATMSVEGVVAELSKERTPQPPDVLQSADAHRSALVDPLLRAIERGLADPAGATEEEATLFCYALYLLAKWRETRAYPFVVGWLSLGGEGAFDIAGDVVTQDGSRILAAVCDGDLEPIKALAVDSSADEFCRMAAIEALALLAAWAEAPRDEIVECFVWLAREGLERERSEVWAGLASSCADIEALEVFPDLRRALDEGLIDEHSMSPLVLDEVESGPRGRELEYLLDRSAPIDDVAEATEWWARVGTTDPSLAREQPYTAPPKIGRNEPCPCGSGRKHKKCCGA